MTNQTSTASAVLLTTRLLEKGPVPAAQFRQLVGLEGKAGAVTAVCFALHHAHAVDRPGVHRLLFHTAPRLVNQLSRTMVPKRVVLRDQPRGKIDWPITYKTRASEGMNPALFVCLENERRYSRPENQLFRWIVYQIERCLAYVPVEMNSWFRSGWDQPGAYQDQRSIGEYLAVLRHQVRHINVHIALRRVELPRAIEDRHLRTARSSKNQLYNDVADVYDAFVSTVLNPTWEAWSTMVRETFPLPADVREQAWLFDSPSS